MASAEARTRAAGMTMLELIVVAGVLAVLIGLGVGFLRRGDSMPTLRSTLNGELRLAALDARTRALPTEVLLTPGEGGAPATIATRGLDPVVLITFEPGQRFADNSIQPQLGGLEIGGRCGKGRAVDAEHGAALQLPLGPNVVDLGDGVALRLDVLLRQRAAGRLLRLGRAVDVQLDEVGQPRVRLQAVGAEGRGGTALNLTPQAPLPIGQWCTFEVGWDGHKVWCTVDGRELAAEPMSERLLQQKDDVLTVLPAEEPLPCVVDELQLFAYMFTQEQRLPDDVALSAPYRVAFDILGEPVSPPELKFEFPDHRLEVLKVGAGGILQ